VPFRNSILNERKLRKGVKLRRKAAVGDRFRQDQQLGLPVIIPVAEFRDLVGAGVTATLSGADPATELKRPRTIPPHPGAQRES